MGNPSPPIRRRRGCPITLSGTSSKIKQEICGSARDKGGVSKYDGKSFTTYTTAQGLANNCVWSILEDKKGNLWFGTWGGGVSRYDGKSFTTYTTEQGLADNFIMSILEDKEGNLWFGTDGGWGEPLRRRIIHHLYYGARAA